MNVQGSGVIAPAFLNLWEYLRYMVRCTCWLLYLGKEIHFLCIRISGINVLPQTVNRLCSS